MMLSNTIIENNKRKIFKYRYVLIVIMGLIIVLLMIFICVIFKFSNKNNAVYISEKTDEDDVMIIELNNPSSDEEEKTLIDEKKEEENSNGIIYLTFDDGPSADITPQILDILDEKQVKATFFILHYSKNNEHLVKRENASGHTVALHGYTHTYSEVYQSADSCINNFKSLQDQVFETIGKKANVIRFPGGSSNTISRKYCQGVMTELSQRVLDEGFVYFDWNVDSDDAGSAKTSEDVYNNVISRMKPHRSNVVLMHDFTNNQKTLNALSSIIDYGLENNFVFRKLTDQTPMVTHSVNN